MKKIIFLTLMIAIVSMSCKDESEPTIKGTFKSIDFIREGGGNIKFKLSPTESYNTINVIVSEYDFKKISIQFNITQDFESEKAYNYFYKVIKAEIQINGDYEQPELPTGTWVYFKAISDQNQFEITNTELRNTLLKFESIVLKHLRN